MKDVIIIQGDMQDFVVKVRKIGRHVIVSTSSEPVARNVHRTIVEMYTTSDEPRIGFVDTNDK